MPDIWDSTFGSTRFSLSSGDIIATAITHNQTDTIIGKQSQTSGKYYFEMTSQNSAVDMAYGLATGTQSNNQLIGTNATSVGWRCNNQHWRFNGAETVSGLGAPSTGNVLGIAVDLDNSKIWIRNATTAPSSWFGNNGAGDPVAGTNGFVFSAFGAAAFLAATSNQNGVDEATTVYSSSKQFIAPAPSGYSDWYSLGPVLIADRVQETTTTTGAGTITLAGATAQFWSLINAIGNSRQVSYCILSGNGTDWEIGLGTLKTGATLTRDTITASSNSNTWVSLTGTSTVYITPSNSDLPNNKVVYPVFPSSTATTLTATLMYVSTSSYTVAEGDAYRFNAVARATGGFEFQILNSLKTKGYRLIYQGDGNIVSYSYNGVTTTVLRASGTNVFVASTECIISGEISFGASSNWLHWPAAGLPITNTVNNWVGDSFFVACGTGVATLSNIKGVTLTKIG